MGKHCSGAKPSLLPMREAKVKATAMILSTTLRHQMEQQGSGTLDHEERETV